MTALWRRLAPIALTAALASSCGDEAPSPEALRALLERGEADRVVTILRDAPIEDAETWRVFAEACRQASPPVRDGAVEAFERLVASGDPERVLMAASVAEAADHPGRARAWIETARKRHPGQRDLESAYARVLGVLGEYRRAAGVLEPIAGADPVLLARAGYMWLLAGELERARPFVDRALAEAAARGVAYPLAHYYRGLLAAAEGESERARVEFATASRAREDLVESHYQWLRAAEETGDESERDEARALFAKAQRERLEKAGAFEEREYDLPPLRFGEIEDRPRLEGRVEVVELPAGVPVATACLAPDAAGARFVVRVVAGPGAGTVLLDVVHGGQPTPSGRGRWYPHEFATPRGDPGATVKVEFRVEPAGAWWSRWLKGEPPAGAAFAVPRALVTASGASRDPRPNVLLISLDTLRADRLGCYGSGRPTSPAIDALASKGVRFARAEAPSAWTLPSHVSMLSGLTPLAHGVLPDMADVRGYLHPDRYLPVRVSSRVEMLAERLAARGYRTAAVTENGWVSAKFGLDQGFDVYRSDVRGALPTTLRAALAELEIAGERTPWFLFVHTYAPHQPYHAPREYRLAWADPDVVGFSWPAALVPIADYYRFRVPLFRPTRDDVRSFRDLYDGQVLWSDTLVRDLVSWLEERGLDRRTIVVVTSDHGEEIFERGQFDHGDTLREEVTHVPLVLWAPGLTPAGRVVDGVVSIVDLPATLLDLAGVTDAFGQGRSLAPLWREGAPPAERAAFAATRGHDGELVLAAWRGFRKLLRRGEERGVIEHLYDLASDPAERNDLIAIATADAERLRGDLARWVEESTALARRYQTERAPLDEGIADALKGLGYADPH